MKQWAIKTPREKIISRTISDTKDDAWFYAREERVTLKKFYSMHIGWVQYIVMSEAKGYSCVRVEVTEVTT
jgi:hypothetical protein